MKVLFSIYLNNETYSPSFLQDNSNKDDKAWVRGVGDHYLATVLYTFETDREEELSVTAGQNIRLAPKHAQPR